MAGSGENRCVRSSGLRPPVGSLRAGEDALAALHGGSCRPTSLRCRAERPPFNPRWTIAWCGRGLPCARRLPVGSLRAGESALGAFLGASAPEALLESLRGALSLQPPPLNKKGLTSIRSQALFLEVAGVEPASPNAKRERLQVCPAVQIVGEGMARRRALSPVYRKWSPLRSGPRGGQALVRLQIQRPLRAWQPGNPSVSVLTQRERGCRYRWHMKVCRIRRSAAPPATRDSDRPGRIRYTPNGDAHQKYTEEAAKSR